MARKSIIPKNATATSHISVVDEWCRENNVMCVVNVAHTGDFVKGTYREIAVAQLDPWYSYGTGAIRYDLKNTEAQAKLMPDYLPFQAKIFSALDAIDDAKESKNKNAEKAAQKILSDLEEQVKPLGEALQKSVSHAEDMTRKEYNARTDTTPVDAEFAASIHRAFLIEIGEAPPEQVDAYLVGAAHRQSMTEHTNTARQTIQRNRKSSKASRQATLMKRHGELSAQLTQAALKGDVEGVQSVSNQLNEVNELLVAVAA